MLFYVERLSPVTDAYAPCAVGKNPEWFAPATTPQNATTASARPLASLLALWIDQGVDRRT